VHEALLSELSETEFKDLNQKIARALDAIGGEGREYCYSLAKHYSLGLCEDNPLRVYETNFKAGILALENYTPNDAYIFFKTADKYASTQEFLFKKNFGIACFQICRMEEALKHFNFALGLTADKLDQVDIRIYLAAINMSDIRTKEALEELKIGFKTVGKPVPEANFFSIFSSLWLFLIWGVLDRFNLMYGSSKGSQSKERLIELKLLDWLSRVQFFILNPIIMLQINFRMLFLAHLVGDSRNTANIYGTFGALVLAGMRKEKAARKMLKKAAAVAYRIADPQAIDRINSGFGTLEYYLGHEREAIIKYRECYKNHLRWLDEQDFNGFHFMFFWELFNNGLIHEALDVIKSYTAALEQKTSQVSSAETRFIMSWLSLSQAYLYLGKTEEAVENFNKAHNVIKKMGWDFSSALSRAAWVFFSLPFLVEKEEIGPQFDDILEVFYKLKLPKSMLENALRTVFVNKCYGRLIQCRASSKPDLKPLEEALKELKSVAKSFKPNFANQHTIEAGLNNLKGQHKKALALLYKAEEIAADIDWPQVHIDIEREKARTYIALGNTPAGVRSAMTALDIAARYDWEHKINQIQKEFGLKTASSGTSFDHITSTSQDTSKFIDSSSLRLKRYLDALLKVSLAASAILNPDQQIRSALDEIVRILGAENAYLFLCKKEDCQEIELKAGRDAQQNDLSLKYASFNNKVLDEVVKTEKAVVLSDKESGSILAAPLIMRDNLIGVMYLSNQLAKDVFTREDVDILLAVSNHIAIALDSAKTIQNELERKSLEKVNLLLGEKVKEKTEELKKTYEKLAHSEKLAALGKLGGAISHEVRTPLAIIKNSAELLSDLVPQKSPDTIRCLEHINNESEKAMLIISDILNFLRIKMPELKTINVEDVIAESVSAISHPRTVKLEMSISRDLPSILADPTQLGQVFNNLIQNAYQAMPKGGTLKIDASRIGDRIQIRFIDSGEGIPEKNLSKIFEMLFTTKQQGTGFGLAICKTIIEGLNGEIAVESTVGKGTTFTVSLPAATRPEA
ncbi:MAG: ATP-binding protein, partial [Candidatus Margulisiibacteriota bacterium]